MPQIFHRSANTISKVSIFGGIFILAGITWALAVCFVVVAFLSWRFFFVAPLIFSALIAACFTAAAWVSS